MLEALRQPVFVPEDVPATAALEAFKRSGMQVALVIDERGNCEGLLTPTDILEALVGEVPDSHNPAKAPPIVHRADGSWLVDGLLAAEELEGMLRAAGASQRGPRRLPDRRWTGDGPADQLGRIPVEGDRFGWSGFSFEVLDMEGHRVDKVLVKKD
jgi:putative hemolysin